MSIRVLDHTADIGYELFATDLPALFGEAVRAFASTLTEVERIRSERRCAFALQAPQLDLLLVELFEELLYRFEVEGLLFGRADFRVTESGEAAALEGSAWGEPYEPGRHPLKVLIKAVTYHGLLAERTDEGWRARVLFDI